jgi:hypothetical protein
MAMLYIKPTWEGRANWAMTTYLDTERVSVAIPAADVEAAGTVNLSSQNRGSGVSNSIMVTVQ